MSRPPSSNDWRRCGNDNYKKAGACSSLVNASGLWKEAIRSYESAFNTATTDEEKRSALRNLGMANWRLGQNCEKRAIAAKQEKQSDGSTYHYDTSHRTEYHPNNMLYFYKEAMSAFSRCRNLEFLGSSEKQAEFLGRLNGNMKECSLEALQFLINMDYFPTYEKRIEQIDYLITACGDDIYLDLSAVFHLEKAKTYHKWAVIERERSKDYMAALVCLKNCYFPWKNIPRLWRNMKTYDSFTRKHHYEVEDLFDSIEADMKVAEAMRFIDQADKHLDSGVFDNDSLDMDKIYLALWDYRAALVALRGSKPELLLGAEAYAKMGQIHFDLLKNEMRAKDYCMQAVHLISAAPQQNFAGRDWFEKATEILKKIQEEQLRKEEEALRKDREPFLKELAKELDDLKKLSEKSAEDLLKELIKLFEPKHKLGTKALEELSKGEYTCKTERSDIKKALTKLILLYHPDHVNVNVYGAKYHVLCEEITKVITVKYECFK